MQEQHEHDLGLAHDLGVLSRRRVFALAGVTGAAAVVAACSSKTGTQASGTTTTAGADGNACPTAAPAETAGPYPGDGSNGPNVLIESGIVRDDIRSSFGTYSGWADGVPTTIELTLLDTTKNCATGAGMAVYVWHCDRAGNYSGRWPHIHFEVFDSLESAVAGENARLTSQIALPRTRARRCSRMTADMRPARRT